MQSRLFQASELTEDFREELASGVRAVAEVTAGQWRRICDDLPALMRLTRHEARQRAIDAQLEEIGLARDVAHRISELAEFLARAQRDPRTRGQPAEVTADLKTISGAQAQDLDAFVRYVMERVAPQVQDVREEQRYTKGVLPFLTGVGATTELRARLRASYSVGEDVETYRPEIVALIPIASIGLVTDDDETFSFQCDRPTLESLLDRLRATMKELDQMALAMRRSADE